MAKYVKVIMETAYTYTVDTAPGQDISDEDAIEVVKKRLEAGMPLDLEDKTERVKKFTVSDK